MRAVVQRVSEASVTVDGERVGQIESGLLVLIGAAKGDTDRDAAILAAKVAGLRIFADENGKMNLNVGQVGGAILAVSQFTLLGDCRKGRRPSFIQAAHPEEAKRLYESYIEHTRGLGLPVETGIFQANMKVSLLNDGPVTLLVDTHKEF
ncbi:MAG: D-aminoacyl-tRNA deacylase [Myxococcota bacterium]|nr:D-aminoacyl-tRNA deacylase [Myxococcota bacterium]